MNTHRYYVKTREEQLHHMAGGQVTSHLARALSRQLEADVNIILQKCMSEVTKSPARKSKKKIV